MSRTVKIRSPKGLVGVRTRQLRPGPLKLPAKLVKKNLARLKRIAAEAIVAGGEKPQRFLSIIWESKQADRAYFGANMLHDLDQIEQHWRQQSDAVLGLVQAALVLAIDYHNLTVVDNEVEINAASKILPALRSGQAANADRHEDAHAKWIKWNAEARSIWDRNRGLSSEAVAKQVKKALGLTEKVGTIRKRLKKVGKAR